MGSSVVCPALDPELCCVCVGLDDRAVAARGLYSTIVSTLGGTPRSTGPRSAFTCFSFGRIRF